MTSSLWSIASSLMATSATKRSIPASPVSDTGIEVTSSLAILVAILVDVQGNKRHRSF